MIDKSREIVNAEDLFTNLLIRANAENLIELQTIDASPTFAVELTPNVACVLLIGLINTAHENYSSEVEMTNEFDRRVRDVRLVVDKLQRFARSVASAEVTFDGSPSLAIQPLYDVLSHDDSTSSNAVLQDLDRQRCQIFNEHIAAIARHFDLAD